MSVPAAYIGVILIWATTPLAIQWSGDGPGFLFGVAARMVIGAVLALALARLLGVRVWRRGCLPVYAAAGLGIYGAMTLVYWAAQQIPSGWISVLFGLAPIITGVLATLWLPDQGLTRMRVTGALIGLAGLMVVFGGARLEHAAALGVVAVVGSAFVHSLSAIWVKRLGTDVHPLAVVAGALSVATPLFVITWALFDGTWPAVLPTRALTSIAYLGVIGSVVGFVLYYYVLGRVDATRVALITLFTPIVALLIGHLFNGEELTLKVLTGAALVLAGLAVFELGDRLRRPAAAPVTAPDPDAPDAATPATPPPLRSGAGPHGGA